MVAGGCGVKGCESIKKVLKSTNKNIGLSVLTKNAYLCAPIGVIKANKSAQNELRQFSNHSHL